jgi:prepilin-type N-terminal cleavage/methylation domain-containing protein
MQISHGARAAPTGGFTLMEMMVVVVIIGLMAAMIVPNLANSTETMSQSAARTVMADLEYAQGEAIMTQTSVLVTFTPTTNSYSLTVPSETRALIHPITKQPYTVDFDTTSGLEGVALKAANFHNLQTVTFSPLGAPDNDGTVTVLAGTHTWVVTVAPVTGRITAAEPP